MPPGLPDLPVDDLAPFRIWGMESGESVLIPGLVMSTVCELEHGHRNSEFSHEKW